MIRRLLAPVLALALALVLAPSAQAQNPVQWGYAFNSQNIAVATYPGIVANIPWVQVTTFGARCDGVTNDAAAFQRAAAVGPVLVPAATCRIATAITLTQPVTLTAGGQLLVDGVVLNLNGGFSAPLQRAFTYNAGGTVVFGGTSPSTTYPEWWGAERGKTSVNATNVTATSQAFAAIGTRGVVLLQAGIYYVNGPIGPNASYKALIGQGSNNTIVTNTSVSTDTLQITGAFNTLIDGAKIIGVGTSRNVTPSTPVLNTRAGDNTWTGGKGLRMYWTANALVQDVVTAEDYVGFYGFCTTGTIMDDTRAVRSVGSGTWFGYVQDGFATGSGTPCAAGTSANGSLKINHGTAAEIAPFSGGSTGFYSFGDIRDQWFDNPETLTDTGISFVSSGTNDFDINLNNPVIDTFNGMGIVLSGLGTSATITITGGWSNPNLGATGANMSITGPGVTVVGHKFFGGPNWASQTALVLNSASNTTIADCIFRNFQYGVDMTSAASVTVTGNTFFNISGQNGQTAVRMTTSSRNSVTNNAISGAVAASWQYGVRSMDAASDFNNFVSQAANPGAIAVSPLTLNGVNVTAQGKVGATNNYAYGVLN